MKSERLHRPGPPQAPPDWVRSFRANLLIVPGAMSVYQAISRVYIDIWEENLRFWKTKNPKDFDDPRTARYAARQICWALEATDGQAHLYSLLDAESQPYVSQHDRTFLGEVGNPDSIYWIIRHETNEGAEPHDETWRRLIHAWTSQIRREPEYPVLGCPAAAMLGMLFSIPVDTLTTKMQVVRQHKGISQRGHYTSVIQTLDSFVHRLMQAWKYNSDSLHGDAMILLEVLDESFVEHNKKKFISAVGRLYFEGKEEDFLGWMDFGRAVQYSPSLYDAWRKSLIFPNGRYVYETAEANALWRGRPIDIAEASDYVMQVRRSAQTYANYTALGQWRYMIDQYIQKMADVLEIPLRFFRLRHVDHGLFEMHVDIQDPQRKEKLLTTIFRVDVNADSPLSFVGLDQSPVSFETEANALRLLLRAFELTEQEHQQPAPHSEPERRISPEPQRPVIVGSSRHRGNRFQPRGEHKRPRDLGNHAAETVDLSPPDSPTKEPFYPRPIVRVEDDRTREQVRKLPKNVRRTIGRAIRANNDLTRDFAWGKELAESAEGPSGGRVWQIRVGKYRVLCEISEDGQARVYDVTLRGDPDRFKKD